MRCDRARSILLIFLLVSAFLFNNLIQSAQAQTQAVTKKAILPGSSPEGGNGTPLPSLFTGTMNYSIPIEVPPGRHGMDPDIALTYNSNGGIGWLGVGWELEMGAIERQTKFGLDYNGDAFTMRMAGATLDLVDVDINSGKYRPQIESEFYRFEKIGSGTNTYWKVTDKTGKMFFFGQTSASRLDNPNNPNQIFRWCLDRVEDPNGNYMTLSYFKNQGQIYLDRIDYAGYKASITPSNYVRFYRWGTSDFSNSSTNFYVRTVFRLNTIEVRANGQLVRAYQLNYDTNPNVGGDEYSPSTFRILLTSVKQFGQDAIVDQNSGAISGGTSLPAVALQYQGGSLGFSQTSDPISEGSVNGADEWLVGDFDGDGRDDVYFRWKSTGVNRLYTSNGDGTFTQHPDPISEASVNGADNWTVGDFNRDGRADVYFRWKSTGMNRLYINNGDGTFTQHLDPISEGSVNGADEWLVGDFDGDGRDDVYFRWKSTGVNRLYTSNGDGTFTQHLDPISDPSVSGADGWSVGDFNGDGRADVFFRWITTGVNRLYISNGNDTFTQYLDPISDLWISYSNYWVVGDFNGDRRADVLFWRYPAHGSQNMLFTSNGDGTFNQIPYPLTPNCPSCLWEYDDWTIGDFNGDGLTDVYFRSKTSIFASPALYSFNGDIGYRGSTPISQTEITGADEWITGDFDGDGTSDVYLRWKSTGANHLYINSFSSAYPDLLSSISNGIHGTTTITYKPSTEYTNTLLPFPVQTVYSVETDDGNGLTSKTHYFYDHGYYYIPEHDFRGFYHVKVTGPLGSNSEKTITETWFHQGCDVEVGFNNPDCAVGYMKGMPYDVKVEDGGSNLYTETTTSYNNDLDGTAAYFNPPKYVDTSICDGDGCGRHLEAYYPQTGYDQYGNVTTEYQYGDLSDPNDDRTITRTFSANETPWIVGLPASESVTYPENGTNRTLTTQYLYDGGTNCSGGSGSSNPSKGNVTSVIRGGISESNMDYDDYGNLKCTQDANGHPATTITYDGSHTLPTVVTNSLGPTKTQYYSGGPSDGGLYGQVMSVTDPNGAVTTFQYDPLGRKTVASFPDGGQTTWAYIDGAVGSQNIYSTTLASQNPLTYLYSRNYFDGLGRTYKNQKSGPGTSMVETVTTYDKRGQVSTVTLPHIVNDVSGTPTTYFHDPMGRVTQVNNPDGSITHSCYNDGVVGMVDANGHLKLQVTDAAGRVVQVNEYTGTNPCSTDLGSPSYATTYFAYNGMGYLMSVTDAKSNVSTMTYDILGRKQTTHDPDMGDWSYNSYDNNGNLLQQTDAKGQKIFFQYDALNRRVQKDYDAQKPLGSGDVVYTYDGNTSYGIGRLTKVQDSSGTTTFYYDSMGRTTRTEKVINNITYLTQTGYDQAGRVTSISYPDGSTVTYTYTGTVLSQVIEGTTPYATYSGHNALGQPTRVDYGNQVYTEYSYYPSNFRLKTLKTTGPDGTLYQNLTYSAYDNVGNITSITDPINGNQTFLYDALNRLYSASGPYGSQLYFSDRIGNMYCNSELSPCGMYSANYSYPTSGASSVRPHAVSTAGPYSYQYDNNGNMISGGGRVLSFDYENRLTSATVSGNTTTFVYDGDGGRVKKTVGSYSTIYIGKLYSCLGATCTKYIFAGDQPIAQKTSTNVLQYYHGDHLGSTNVITNSDGSLYEQIIYYPYGRTYLDSASPPPGVPYKFTGQVRDYSTGLYFYNARYYDPALGRFIQADTIVPGATNPQALNRYSYVLGNPINLTDPTGNHHHHHHWWSHFKGEVHKLLTNPDVDVALEATGIGIDVGIWGLMQSNTGRDILAGEIVAGTAAATWYCGGCGVAGGALMGEAFGAYGAERSGGDLLTGVGIGGLSGAAGGAVGGWMPGGPASFMGVVANGAVGGFVQGAGYTLAYGGGWGQAWRNGYQTAFRSSGIAALSWGFNETFLEYSSYDYEDGMLMYQFPPDSSIFPVSPNAFGSPEVSWCNVGSFCSIFFNYSPLGNSGAYAHDGMVSILMAGGMHYVPAVISTYVPAVLVTAGAVVHEFPSAPLAVDQGRYR
jgi:RHS repeat-associated protein